MEESIDEWIEKLLLHTQAKKAAKKQRQEHPYVLYLIKVLWPYRYGLRRADVIERIWALREPKGLPMPKNFGETIQSSFNHHTSQSAEFIKRGTGSEEDLFFSPKGKGSGIWAVHPDRAEAWLKRKQLEI